VLYAGLLDLAHQQGLKAIQTELAQVPSEENGRGAIFKATVILEKEGVERVFTGYGDAAPNNVASLMQTCLLRMAETRAKARALRDAVNVGVAAFEELDDEEAFDGAPERGYAISPPRPRSERSASARGTSGSVANGAEKSNGHAGNGQLAAKAAIEKTGEGMPIPEEMRHPGVHPITEPQKEAIRNLCRRRSQDADALAKERFAAEGLDALTQAQASELIKSLNERAPSSR
jgi:hypothetical protein